MYTLYLQPGEGKALGRYKHASSETWDSLTNTRYHKFAGSLTREERGG